RRPQQPIQPQLLSAGEGARFAICASERCAQSQATERPLSAALFNEVRAIQKLSFSANWISRGLLLVAVTRPKSPGSAVTWPVVGLMDVEGTALKLLTGFAKLT